MYGGRGGAKSHSIARALLQIGSKKCTRIVCGRETQTSIKDSVKYLFDSVIKDNNLPDWVSTQDYIKNVRTGTYITFIGLQDHNSQQVKGLEAVDIFWGDEANQFTERTLKFLIPTIRKAKSEIWFSWNPEYPTDAIEEYRHNRRENAIYIEVGWQDNRFLSEEALEEKDHLKKTNFAEYMHVWEGGYKPVGENKLFDYAVIEQATKRTPTMTNTAVKAGFDVAREGSDKAVLYIVQGKRTVAVYDWDHTKDTYKLGLKVAEKCLQHDVTILSVDSVGVGGGVADTLRRTIKGTTKVVDFDCRRKSGSKKFADLKTEAMYKAMEWLRDGGSIPYNTLLINSLISVEYDHDGKDRLILVSKKRLKARGIPSHDFADALAMAIYSKPVLTVQAPKATRY